MNEPGSSFLFVRKQTGLTDTWEDLAAWEIANSQKTQAAYQTYLQRFPNGDFALSASKELQKLEKNTDLNLDLRDWQRAKSLGTTAAYREYLQKHPKGKFRLAAEDAIMPEEIPDMVMVPGGEFQMGDLFEDKDPYQEFDQEFYEQFQVHTVMVDDFYLGAHEVTYEEYDAYCEAIGKEKPVDNGWGRGRRPVIGERWFDVIEYCNWRSKYEGLDTVYTIDKSQRDPNYASSSADIKWIVTCNWEANGYRLPTEAEWEYAAREGGKKVRFGSGKDIADPREMNFQASEEVKTSYSRIGHSLEQTVPMGYFETNNLGLYNMGGNVSEWCWDWYASDYYIQSTGSQNPRGPGKGSNRVVRGGVLFPSSAPVEK